MPWERPKKRQKDKKQNKTTTKASVSNLMHRERLANMLKVSEKLVTSPWGTVGWVSSIARAVAWVTAVAQIQSLAVGVAKKKKKKRIGEIEAWIIFLTTGKCVTIPKSFKASTSTFPSVTWVQQQHSSQSTLSDNPK